MHTELKTIGLIGGITWGATAAYYRLLNTSANERLGDHHSAQLLVRSFDFQPLLERVEQTAFLENLFEETGRALAAAGAALLGIASFTGHRYAAGLRRGPLPLVDLVDEVAARLSESGSRRVAIWATSYALRDDALIGRLAESAGVQLLAPPEVFRSQLDDVAFSAGACGAVADETRALMNGLIARQAAEQRADSLLLATTDFSPLASRIDTDLPIFDAADIHCTALLDAALSTERDAR